MKNEITISSPRYVWMITLFLVIVMSTSLIGRAQTVRASSNQHPVTYSTLKIDNLEIFYREAGDPNRPTILLLHGFPTSSHMFRNLIPLLAHKYHVVAPDYPGFGYSSAPSVSEFTYTFDQLTNIIDRFIAAKGLKKYSLYLQDYGAPIGYRLAVKYPERVEALIVQNGNAYQEGLRGFWNPLKNYWEKPTEENVNKLRHFLKLEATKWQYTHGTRNPHRISPDTWTLDQALLDRPGNQEIQLKLFLDYGSNPPLYPRWHEYFRKHQPPTLIVWGKNDQIFPAEGAEPYKRDLKNIEFHLLDTGHFALEEEGDRIAQLILSFLAKQESRKEQTRRFVSTSVHRKTTNDAWQSPVNLGPTVNSGEGEASPSISTDGLELYFDSGSHRPGGQGMPICGSQDVRRARRRGAHQRIWAPS